MTPPAPSRSPLAARRVGVREARTRLSSLLRRVEAGETVVITRNGAAVAELRPPAPPPALGWDLPDRDALLGALRPEPGLADDLAGSDG